MSLLTSRRLIFIFFALCLAIAASCSTNEAPAPITGARVTATIGAEGGVVTHASGASVNVPAGALRDATTLSIEAVDAPSASALGAEPVAQGFLLEPAGIEFAAPVTVTIPYDPAKGTDPTSLRVLYAENSGAPFTPVTTEVDAARHVLVAKSLHFSIYTGGLIQNPLFILSQSPLPVALQGTPFSFTFETAQGQPKPPYVFRIARGALPSGVQLSSGGVLSGTPGSFGDFGFTLQVTDADTPPHQIEGPFLWKVKEAIVPSQPVPIITSVTPSNIAANAGDTQLTINGFSFTRQSVAMIDNESLSTLFVDNTRVLAIVPAAHLAAPAHVVPIAVQNPAPGGGKSNVVNVAVTIGGPGDGGTDAPADGGSVCIASPMVNPMFINGGSSTGWITVPERVAQDYNCIGRVGVGTAPQAYMFPFTTTTNKVLIMDHAHSLSPPIIPRYGVTSGCGTTDPLIISGGRMCTVTVADLAPGTYSLMECHDESSYNFTFEDPSPPATNTSCGAAIPLTDVYNEKRVLDGNSRYYTFTVPAPPVPGSGEVTFQFSNVNAGPVKLAIRKNCNDPTTEIVAPTLVDTCTVPNVTFSPSVLLAPGTYTAIVSNIQRGTKYSLSWRSGRF